MLLCSEVAEGCWARVPACTPSASVLYGAGPVLVAGACSLIGYAASVDIRYLLPTTGNRITGGKPTEPGSSREWLFHAGVSSLILGNVAYNYIRCVITNPGDTDSKYYKQLVADATEQGLIPEKGTEDHRCWIYRDAYQWTFCRHCGEPKPPRAHFDHVTERLVLNMDHYCPWMFNVVGYGNYHFFWRTLLYASIFSARLTAATFRVLGDARSCKQIGEAGVKSVITLQSIGIGTTVAVIPLYCWHVYLMSSGQTTIEYFGNSGEPRCNRQRNAVAAGLPCPRSPYSLGVGHNWASVLGSCNPLYAFLPLGHTGAPPYPPDDEPSAI